jgi:hypothetical protein
MDVSRRLIRYWADIETYGAYGAYGGVVKVLIRIKPGCYVKAELPDGTHNLVGHLPKKITEKYLNSRGYFKTQREALLHAQMKLKSHTRRLQKWRKENREHLTEVKRLLEECK